MKNLNNNNLQDLNHKEIKTINGGGPGFEGIAWIAGFIYETALQIAEDQTHPGYTHNGGYK